MKVSERRTVAKQLEAVFVEQKKAAYMASTATGFIMSICFIGLPLMWSSLFHYIPVPSTTCAKDPWSGITDL